jgi:hypothetical protein
MSTATVLGQHTKTSLEGRDPVPHGVSLVEILTMGPTGWFVETAEAPEYLAGHLGTVRFSGVLKDILADDGASQ